MVGGRLRLVDDRRRLCRRRKFGDRSSYGLSECGTYRLILGSGPRGLQLPMLCKISIGLLRAAQLDRSFEACWDHRKWYGSELDDMFRCDYSSHRAKLGMMEGEGRRCRSI
jgi:hypothetical protein